MIKKASFKRKANIASFRPVCSYSNFQEYIEEVNNTEDGGTDVLIKQALVAVEGTFKDSDGRPHEFSPDRLETIAEHTNKALDTGVVVPVCTDHKKEFNNTVGSLGDNANAYTKVITEEDLPNPRAKHLVGKMGLFLQDVNIKAKDAISKVRDGIVTSVSMGLNLDPKDHRIVELSLVPIPAIPNMGLFQLGMNLEESDETAVTWEELETSEQTLDEMKEEYYQLVERLWKLLDNIYTSESADITDLTTLKQYVYTVLNGFSVRVLDVLGLSNVPDAPDPAQDASAMSADSSQAMGQAMAQDQAAPSNQPVSYSYQPKGLLLFNRPQHRIRNF